MNEDDSGTTVELGPDIFEIGMAEIMVTFAVAGEERYTVCLEYVERIGDFLQGIFFVEKVGQSCEKAIFFGVPVA